MNLHESGEMYLKVIYLLSARKPHVRSMDICDYMGFSKPSVSRGLSRLKADHYAVVDENNFIHLTESGLEVAEKLVERSKVITALLISLGVDPETAEADACKIEHDISDDTFAAIKRTVGK